MEFTLINAWEFSKLRFFLKIVSIEAPTCASYR